MANARGFTQQAHRVLDPEKTVVDYNHKWLGELDFGDVIRLASHFTVQQFLARDNFSKRHATGEPIWLHEFFYALMQGYDAIMLDTDVQIGGTDQLFNLMARAHFDERARFASSGSVDLPDFGRYGRPPAHEQVDGQSYRHR